MESVTLGYSLVTTIGSWILLSTAGSGYLCLSLRYQFISVYLSQLLPHCLLIDHGEGTSHEAPPCSVTSLPFGTLRFLHMDERNVSEAEGSGSLIQFFIRLPLHFYYYYYSEATAGKRSGMRGGHTSITSAPSDRKMER